MTLFGIGGRRLALYGGVIAALLVLNALRYMEPERPDATTGPDEALAPLSLPALAIAPAGDTGAEPPARDLFRPPPETPAPPPPAPEPAPPPPPPPAADPRAEAIAAAQKKLDEIVVVGILTTSAGMVALINDGESVENARTGDFLIPGFRISEISMDGLRVENEELGLRRTLPVGGSDGN